jgi:GT2 family glycosyltransferase
VHADWPLVSIVFVAYNRREKIAISLEHVLERLDYPADRVETIVVDNASTDGTAEMIRERFPQVQLIVNPENVGASAWNVGMTTARGRWRLILDDDCYLTGDALRVAVERAEEHRADLVSFRIGSSEGPGFFNIGNFDPGLLGFVGCAALFSERAIETEPFYDPNLFIWGNEVELTMRLLDRGFRHLFLPEVVAIHQKAIPDPTEFPVHFNSVNQQHWAYSAGKLMQPGDAVVVLGRILLRTAIDARNKDRRLAAVLPRIVAGFVRGLRARRPMRPEVSTLYREVCADFSSPFAVMRTPMQRLRHRGDPEAVQRARDERRARRAERFARYYPARADVLEV